MRWILVATLVACSSLGICSSAARADDAPSVVDVSEAAPGVVINAIPSPTPVIEVLRLDNPAARLPAAKKQRLAKKKALPTMMLTRTERRQVQLLAADTKSAAQIGASYNPNDDAQSGLDELDFHRSYSRPRLISEADDPADAEPELSAHVRLRLLMARLKALEAHALNQVQDDGEALPDPVRQRLREARLKAVQAHQQKFS